MKVLNLNISRQDGFSMVEPAMVLVVVGLLIAGIFKGQQLLLSATSSAVPGAWKPRITRSLTATITCQVICLTQWQYGLARQNRLAASMVVMVENKK